MLELPKDVVEFLNADASVRTSALRINPLSLEQCIANSTRVREIPVAAELGLVVLDDANDSNPYCLITRGPASGMVVHFSHDAEPTLAFPDLATFLQSLRAAVRDHRNIDQLERHQFCPLPNQPALRSTLHAFPESDDDEAPLVVAILFPLDPDERDTVLPGRVQHRLSHSGGRRTFRRGPSCGALPPGGSGTLGGCLSSSGRPCAQGPSADR